MFLPSLISIAGKAIWGHAVKRAATGAVVAVAGKVTAGLGESFVKNVFCDIVKPVRGSILKVDLAGGVVSHSGIYLGENQIAEVAEIKGRAIVRVVAPSEFLSGDAFVRTGAYIYVASAKGNDGYYPLARESIAKRAELELGARGKYSLIFNNCHMFTRYCITGECAALPTWSKDELLQTLKNEFGVSTVSWRSTGDFSDAIENGRGCSVSSVSLKGGIVQNDLNEKVTDNFEKRERIVSSANERIPSELDSMANVARKFSKDSYVSLEAVELFSDFWRSGYGCSSSERNVLNAILNSSCDESLKVWLLIVLSMRREQSGGTIQRGWMDALIRKVKSDPMFVYSYVKDAAREHLGIEA